MGTGRSRPDVAHVCCPTCEAGRIVMRGDMRQDALNRIGSRHVGDDPHPPTAVRAEAAGPAQIDREDSAETLHPRLGCGG